MASTAFAKIPWASSTWVEIPRGTIPASALSALPPQACRCMPLVPRRRPSAPEESFRGGLSLMVGACAAVASLARSHRSSQVARGARDSQRRYPQPPQRNPYREPGERAFEELYRPSMRLGDRADEESEEEDRGPRKSRARWKDENDEMRDDPAYGMRREIDPSPRRGRGRRFEKSKVVDYSKDLERGASHLRSMYKRPRFGWKDVQQDDLSSQALSGNMPAIGSGEVWLSKFLSHAGVCSRRTVKEVVLQGRVTVNGQIVQDPVMKVDPKTDSVEIDGKVTKLRTLNEMVWIMVNKPKDIITTMKDSEGRKTVMDLVPFARKRRLVPVGRVDRNATGLVLLTNDYEWHTILAHPRYQVTKRYKVVCYNGVPSRDKMKALETGLELPDEARPLIGLGDLEVLEKKSSTATLGFTLQEGKYRQILRMFEYIGHPVRAVKRTAYGDLKMDRDLKPGEWRVLTPKEVRRLKGPTILKRPSGDPLARQKQLQGEEDEADQEDRSRDRGRYDDEEMPSDRRQGRPRWRDEPEKRQDDRFQRRPRWGDEREERQDNRFQRRRGDSMESGRRRGRSRGQKSGWDDEEDDSQPPREASIEDLRDLERRFGLEGQDEAPAPAESGDAEDWEASWIQQLDQMQAEKSR